MLVRIVDTNITTGEVTERWVEMPDVVTPEAQALVDQQNAAAAEAVATNERTIGQSLESALLSNQTVIATLNAWLAANTGTLTAAQLSAAMRTAASNQVAQFRQLNGLIRLVRKQLSTADLNSAAKS